MTGHVAVPREDKSCKQEALSAESGQSRTNTWRSWLGEAQGGARQPSGGRAF